MPRVGAVGWILGRHSIAALKDLLKTRRASSLATRLRLAIEDLGPTFVKLGQVLSTRPDILPDALAAELALLQDHARVVAFVDIRRRVEAELAAPLEELYAYFETEPLAQASIGQVHRAALMDGTEVIVKVRRPGVMATIDLDLRLLDRTARIAERASRVARRYDAAGLARRFAATLREECNYLIEGKNAEAIALALRDSPHVYVPAIAWGYTSLGVLTEMRVDGVKIDDLEALEALGVDRKTVAATFVDAYLTMVFGDGVFHADPHPGNVFVDSDGCVGFVDFGMTGEVAPATIRSLGGVLLAIVGTDPVIMADALLSLGVAAPNLDRRRLEEDLGRLLSEYAHRPLDEMPVAEVLTKVMGIVRRHHLVLPPDLALLVKTVMMCEGVALHLDPGFLLVPRLLPFASRVTYTESDGPQQ
ncbi:MAG: AarF/UbiB family protein [Actinomycetes bacterium]